MALEQKDIEIINKIVQRLFDDMSLSIERGFERFSERLDNTETRIYSRLTEIQDRIEGDSEATTYILELLRDEIRDLGGRGEISLFSKQELMAD